MFIQFRLMRLLLLCGATIFVRPLATGQIDVPLINPSFESAVPNVGNSAYGYFWLKGWKDWMLFGQNVPPDIHGANTHFCHVGTRPQNARAYIGLTTRSDSTWACIAQKLQIPLKRNVEYDLTLYTCRDSSYSAPTPHSYVNVLYLNPTIIRIWGSEKEFSRGELLAISDPITHSEWRQYTFQLHPGKEYSFLVIEAYYSDEWKTPANGHVLIDNAKLVRYE